MGILEARGGRLVQERGMTSQPASAKASSVRKRWVLEALAGTLIAASMVWPGARQAFERW